MEPYNYEPTTSIGNAPLDNDTYMECHNACEDNKDERFIEHQKMLGDIKFCLAVIALALCAIAFCNLYDFYIKYQLIKSIKETSSAINQSLLQYFY